MCGRHEQFTSEEARGSHRKNHPPQRDAEPRRHHSHTHTGNDFPPRGSEHSTTNTSHLSFRRARHPLWHPPGGPLLGHFCSMRKLNERSLPREDIETQTHPKGPNSQKKRNGKYVTLKYSHARLCAPVEAFTNVYYHKRFSICSCVCMLCRIEGMIMARRWIWLGGHRIKEKQGSNK